MAYRYRCKLCCSQYQFKSVTEEEMRYHLWDQHRSISCGHFRSYCNVPDFDESVEEII